MVLLSRHGLPAAQIAELLDCHPATVRRWISRFNSEGLAGLADRPRCGRPRLGGLELTRRIAALLARPGPWTLPRIRRYLGWPQVSPRTLYRRVRLMAIWRRPKLIARGDPARPAPADPLLLPHPLTGSDAGHRRALDQPLAASGLRADLLECCFSACSTAGASIPGSVAGVTRLVKRLPTRSVGSSLTCRFASHDAWICALIRVPTGNWWLRPRLITSLRGLRAVGRCCRCRSWCR